MLYEGEAVKCIDLREGTFDDPVFYREAFDKLTKGLCDFLENNNVDLKCLFDDCGEPIVPVKDAVEKIIDKLCNLTTDDISSTASSFCVGNNATTCGARLLNRHLKWSTTNFEEGTRFTYDFSEAIANLPEGYSVSSIEVKANGKSTGTVNTLFANSDKRTGGFNVSPNRFPVTVDARCNLDTPCGRISLCRTVGISSAQEGGFSSPLDIEDTGSTRNFGAKNLTQQLEEHASQICINKNEIDSLKDISVQDCENVQYPSNDIHTVIQVQGAKVCESLYRLDNIGEEQVLLTDCDDQCGVNTYESTLQSALDRMSEIMCKNQERIVELENRVQELELKVEKCCDGGGNGTAGSSSGSSSGGGGCAGGNCSGSSSNGNFNTGGGFGGGGTITGNPNGGNGNGNGNPETCNDSPVSIDWSYDCTNGLSYTVIGAVGGFTVSMSGVPAQNGDIFDDGIYVLRVVDGRSCSSSASVSINCCSIDFTSNYDCNNGLTVQISGGTGNNTITVGQNQYTQGMTLTDGSHTITVKDNTENCTESKIINIDCEADPQPCDGVILSVSANANNYCDDNSVDVNFSGGQAPYSISVNGNQLASGLAMSPATIFLSGFSNESIVVQVTDTNGCSGSTSVFIPSCVQCTLTVGAPITDAFSCDSSSHVLNFSVTRPIGEYIVTITDRDTNTVVKTLVGQTGSNSFSENVGVGTSTSYLIEVVDSEGCTSDTIIDTTPCP